MQIYENDKYTVETTTKGIQPGDTQGLPCYQLINKETTIVEGEFFFYPQACLYANQLAENIEDFQAGIKEEDPLEGMVLPKDKKVIAPH